MELRLEHPEDRNRVRELHLAAFGDHGGTVADLVDALRRSLTPDTGLSLVAEDARGLVGHVMFTRSLLDAPRRLVDVQVLSPLAVIPGRQGKGIGSALVQRGLDIMTESSYPLVFLEGPADYYARFGFVAGAPQGFRKPSLRIPDAAFQVMRLPAYESWMSGTLVYFETFWLHDAVGLRDPDG